VIQEATQSTLSFLAGYLAGAMDRRMGTGRAWTMMCWCAAERGELDVDYLYRLERTIRRRWPEGEVPPSIADALRPRDSGLQVLQP
jgi:hypothetical protein